MLTSRELRASTPDITLRDTIPDDQSINDIFNQDDNLPMDLCDQQNETCDLPTNVNNQQLLISDMSKSSKSSNTTTIMTSSSLIGPFKNELEVCLFMSQRQDLVNLTLNIMKASGHEPEIIQKPDKSNILSDKVSLICLVLLY